LLFPSCYLRLCLTHAGSSLDGSITRFKSWEWLCVVAWRQSSHTTDGTPTSQPAGWSCLTAKTAASNTESQITVAEGSADAERCCFPISVEISDDFVFRKQ
ncbi:hypothetical protein XENORESO_006473, partial [Xenotaenia resolanae]